MVLEKETEKKYWAFISYSSKDRKWGQWLHKRLENYPIPEEFRGTELFDGAILGKSLRPIFRDRDELSGSADLGPAIQKALEETRYLIVLCSKNSAKSEWVDKEIEDFKALGRERQILALILDGVPNATCMPGVDSGEECFPPALQYPTEPLAGDLRKEGDGKERGFLKILAGIAQLDFDSLYRRHERSQRRKLMLLASVAGAVIFSLTALSVFALAQKKEAVKQRAAAQTNEIVAKQNEEIAEEQRAIATMQAMEAKVDLSNKLLEQGLAFLASGMVDEGLASLRNSLEKWPSNVYSRDRLLYELSHRSWLLPVASEELPFRLLADEPASGSDVTVALEFRHDPNGSFSIVESTKVYDQDSDEEENLIRTSVRNLEGEWIVGDTEKNETRDAGMEDEGLAFGDGYIVFAEPVETRQGLWDVAVKKGEDLQAFRAASYDGKSFEEIIPFGVPVLSPDDSSIAIVGMQRPSSAEEHEGYLPDGEVHVSLFDSSSLIQKGDGFSYPIPADAEISRVWWSGKILAIHTQQDNRSIGRFDLIDFSGDYPRFILKNKGMPGELWTYDKGKILYLEKGGEADKRRFGILEIRETSLAMDDPGEMKPDDFIWFHDQEKEREETSVLGEGGYWERVGEASKYRQWFSRESGRARISKWESAGKSRTAAGGFGGIKITREEGLPEIDVRISQMSGEGGRGITGSGFSPGGEYVVVKGFSVGGGVSDWEIIGADVGLQVFPVVFPRERSDEIQLVPFYERAGIYGLEAVGWSRDGKFLALATESPFRAEASDTEDTAKNLWKKNLYQVEGEEGFRESFLVPIRFCEGRVPEWFLDVVDQIIGLRVGDNGQVQKVFRVPVQMEAPSDEASSGEYEEWLSRFLGN